MQDKPITSEQADVLLKLAAAAVMLAEAEAAIQRGRSQARPVWHQPRPRYDWIDHVCGLSLMDKVLGIK